MFVTVAMIVVEMGGANPLLHCVEARAHTITEMGVAYIEAEPYIFEMGGSDDLLQPIRSSNLIVYVLKQHRHSQRLGKKVQVLQGSDGILHFAGIPLLLSDSQMLNQEAKGSLLR